MLPETVQVNLTWILSPQAEVGLTTVADKTARLHLMGQKWFPKARNAGPIRTTSAQKSMAIRNKRVKTPKGVPGSIWSRRQKEQLAEPMFLYLLERSALELQESMRTSVASVCKSICTTGIKFVSDAK